jgi:hypothetical protein
MGNAAESSNAFIESSEDAIQRLRNVVRTAVRISSPLPI